MIVKFYSKFFLDKAAKCASHKYYMGEAAGYAPEFDAFKGRNGKFNLYLKPKREGQSIDAPSMYFQIVKTNMNFTGLKEYFADGKPTGYAFGEPFPKETYKGKPNPLYDVRNDGYLFKLAFDERVDNEAIYPSSFELIVVDGGRVLISSYAKMLHLGLLDEELERMRKQATTI